MTEHSAQISEQRLAHEAGFADADYRRFDADLAINPTMFKKYSSPCDFSDWRQKAAALLGPLKGRRILDLGCGMGEEAVYFAKLGADVTAIDVSEVGIRIATKRAQFNGVNIDAQIMACPTSFKDESFDIIHGLGIVHHVGVEPFFQDVIRLLKPGGFGVFLEPMGDVAWVKPQSEVFMHDYNGDVT